MKILRSNLQAAISGALTARRNTERVLGYDRDSAFCAGLQETLNALNRGEPVRIEGGDDDKGILAQISSMTASDREKLFNSIRSEYCIYCGSDNVRCPCNNDD